jgi:hypothetical protein
MEKDRVVSEKDDVAQTVASLQHDLQRVKKDAEAFGRDLRLLRIEKERLEAKQQQDISRADRLKKQTDTQVRLLNEQLESQRGKTMRAENELRNHICEAYVSVQNLDFYPAYQLAQQGRPRRVCSQTAAQQGVQGLVCADSVPESKILPRGSTSIQCGISEELLASSAGQI